MPRPSIRVNTFMQYAEESNTDPTSKIFIILEVLFGLNRMPLIGKGKFIYVFLTCAWSVILNSVLIYLPGKVRKIRIFHIAQFIICGLLSFTHSKWFLSYYRELNRFDKVVLYRPKMTFVHIKNVLQALLTCFIYLIISEIRLIFGYVSKDHLIFKIIPLAYIIDVTYLGHLLNLITPRLKLINCYIESSLCSLKAESMSVKQFAYSKHYNTKHGQINMVKLMDVYQIVVNSYDYFIKAIKWQFLLHLVSVFVTTLDLMYWFSSEAIRGDQSFRDSIHQIGLSVTLLIPLFSLCAISDGVQCEVRKLRELLASSLYENKLDKYGRSIARTLLAYTETRNLSFKILRVLNIDISLPFKLVSLLVTYLIILLQFEKVVNS